VDVQDRHNYLRTYQRVDVALDSLPYNGHTTSLDAFWMGVPVVTLVGTTIVGRAGLCQAYNLGLVELVAQHPDEFVKIAVELAKDLPRLNSLRQELRARLANSPLMDAPRFTRDLEGLYREAWRRWCATPS
jgi:predicted O-linked N-acetylglucosamine transferase (SPINDLY family)